MENNLSIKQKCYCCRNEYAESDKFCGTCGYPLQGTDIEKKKFSSQYVANLHEKEVVLARIKEARIILYVIAAFTTIQGLVVYFKEPNVALISINLIIVAIYVGLGFWATKKAFAAIFIGGIIYVSLILLNGFIDPTTLASGILIKILFIAAFVRASYGAYKYKV